MTRNFMVVRPPRETGTVARCHLQRRRSSDRGPAAKGPDERQCHARQDDGLVARRPAGRSGWHREIDSARTVAQLAELIRVEMSA